MKLSSKADRILGWIILIVLGSLSLIVCIWTVDDSMDNGHSFLYSLILGLFGAAFTPVAIVLLWLVGWRIFTKEGREAEEIARARYEIKKSERKRAKEWKRYYK